MTLHSDIREKPPVLDPRSRRRIRAGGAAAAAALALVLTPSISARADFENARRGGMGDVITAADGGGRSGNVAFRAVPEARGRPRVIPLPLGVVQVALAPPSFSASSPDFSAVEIADLVLSPPFDLRLTSPPSGEDAHIAVRVAENEIALDLGKARSLVPPEAFARGGRFSSELVSSDIGWVNLGMSPIVTARTRLDLSDELRSALRDGTPLTSSGTYFLDHAAEAQAAMAIGVAHARQVAGPPEPAGAGDLAGSAVRAFASGSGNGWRLYAGAGAKYLVGIAYFETSGRLEVVPAEPLLDPADPTDVLLRTTVRSAVPGSPGTVGQGVAFDLGLAALHGEAWEIGLGACDLAGSISWRTHVEEVTLDQTTGELVSRTIAEGARHRSRLTPEITGNVARHWGARTTLATDVRHGIAGTSWHLGGETHLGRYALRGGAILDPAGQLQGTGGGGVRLGRVGFDASLASTSANLAEERALLVGLSLAIY